MATTSQTLPEWLDDFRGEGMHAGYAIGAIVATTDLDGWPHLAYLSIGEVLVRDSGISIMLWPASGTAANIERDGRAAFYVAANRSVFEARLALERRPGERDVAIFDGTILATRCHSAPYADVMALVDFRLHDEATARARWSAQIERMRGDS